MIFGNTGFFDRIARLVRGPRERLALDYLLANADPDAPLADRVEWLTELLRWIRLHEKAKAVRSKDGAEVDPAEDAADASSRLDKVTRIRVARMRFLLRVIERNPVWKSQLARTLRSVLRDTHALRLFATTGLPQEFGFLGEATRRISAKLLPDPPAFGDLAQVFVALFPDRGDEVMPLALPYETQAALRALFRYDEPADDACWAVVRRDLADAVAVLVAQVAAIGLSDGILRRAPSATVSRSPFLSLGPIAEEYFEGVAASDDEAASAVAHARLATEIARCRDVLDDAMSHLEEYGVSVSLVYKIELARQQLRRVESLAALAVGERAPIGAMVRFVASLIRDMHAQRSVRALLRSNLDLMTRKIAERTGKTGDHYITRDSVEYADMLRSAGRGGGLTGFTVFIKFLTVGHGLPPFVEGLGASLNYAVSFCAIQAVHGTLATKQPAMTAAAMAARLKVARFRGRLREFVNEVANLTRSQVAAILGNLVIVVPAALVIELVWVLAGGELVPNAEKAHATIQSLSIWGATPIYAAYTGVLLWLSAVLSGWIENWTAYRRLPAALANQPRLVYAFGEDRMHRVAAWFERNIAGLGGNIALGFLLGMTPEIARFFGVPLEVRHVTLSTGSLALAVSTLGVGALSTGPFWMACAGIAVIGFLNLTVSFTLALWVAIRATRAGALSRRRVFRALFARVLKSPRDFLLPPRAPRNPEVRPAAD
jgi:site-specific recombinase